MKKKEYYVEQEWRYSTDTIVKYIPQYYNNEGHYIKHEWTSRYDVGLTFDNCPFTIEEYMFTEQKYVDAILKIMEMAKCKYLTIAHIGDNLRASKWSTKEILTGEFSEYDKNLYDFYSGIYEGQRLNKNNIDKLVRLNLRELTYTDIVNESRHLEFHFGYDYYMYCNNQLPKDVLKAEIKQIGLYLNPMD